MTFTRRKFLTLAGGTVGVAALSGCRYSLTGDILNPCLAPPLPESLARHELVLAALEGLDGNLIRDAHVHILGDGSTGSGAWVNPAMASLWNPAQYIRRKFYLNASCVEDGEDLEQPYVDRLLALTSDLPPGMRLLLLAFDYRYTDTGERDQQHSSFHVPDSYAASIAQRYPDRFEWMASIHPYRQDAVPALEQAIKSGAKAVKWLPPVMGMDPASPKCDAFYAVLAHHAVPLLVHVDEEHAVDLPDSAANANPLRMRRALDHGVRVIIAHCATNGASVDLDKGPNAGTVPNFELFARLMDDKRYEHRIFGDVSAISQVNRPSSALKTVIERQDWHDRLIYGSDYPLVGVMPLYSIKKLSEQGLLDQQAVPVLTELRRYNPLLFDLVHKRLLRSGTARFADSVFHNARIFN